MLVVDDRLFPRVAGALGAHSGPGEDLRPRRRPAPAGTAPAAPLFASSDAVPADPVDEDDAFVILYTSGTTGRPKGCITTHRGTIAQVMGILLERHDVRDARRGQPASDRRRPGRRR